MGFPDRMFTVLFAIGRLPGWIAQWREMVEDPQNKIGRPRQLYTGVPEREYVALASAEPLSPDRRGPSPGGRAAAARSAGCAPYG